MNPNGLHLLFQSPPRRETQKNFNYIWSNPSIFDHNYEL
jgi:hypothetical protein